MGVILPITSLLGTHHPQSWMILNNSKIDQYVKAFQELVPFPLVEQQVSKSGNEKIIPHRLYSTKSKYLTGNV